MGIIPSISSSKFQPAMPVGVETSFLKLAGLWNELSKQNGFLELMNMRIESGTCRAQAKSQEEEAHHKKNEMILSACGQIAMGSFSIAGGGVEMKGALGSSSEIDEQLDNAREFQTKINNPSREVELSDRASGESEDLKERVNALKNDPERMTKKVTEEDEKAIDTAGKEEIKVLKSNVDKLVKNLSKQKQELDMVHFRRHDAISKILVGTGEGVNGGFAISASSQANAQGKDRAASSIDSTTKDMASQMKSHQEQRQNADLGNIPGVFQALIAITNAQVSQN